MCWTAPTGNSCAATFIDDMNWAHRPFRRKASPILMGDGAKPSVKGTLTCPSTAGATNWPSPTYNPETGWLYFHAVEGCGVNFRSSVRPAPAPAISKARRNDRMGQPYPRHGSLDRQAQWDVRKCAPTIMAPACFPPPAALLFAPEQFGQVAMLDAKTGKPSGTSIPATSSPPARSPTCWMASNISPSRPAPISSPSACRTGRREAGGKP